MKKLMLICAPVSSRSGYGDHARDLVRAFIKLDKFNVKIFDVFSGGNMPTGKKSIAINVLIQSIEKTLSQKDLDDISQKIIDIVKAKTGGTIRS